MDDDTRYSTIAELLVERDWHVDDNDGGLDISPPDSDLALRIEADDLPTVFVSGSGSWAWTIDTHDPAIYVEQLDRLVVDQAG